MGPERVSSWLGMRAETGTGEPLGEVTDVLLDGSMRIAAVEIGVGGFLGFGERPVLVPADLVALNTSGGRALLVLSVSAAEVSAVLDAATDVVPAPSN